MSFGKVSFGMVSWNKESYLCCLNLSCLLTIGQSKRLRTFGQWNLATQSLTLLEAKIPTKNASFKWYNLLNSKVNKPYKTNCCKLIVWFFTRTSLQLIDNWLAHKVAPPAHRQNRKGTPSHSDWISASVQQGDWALDSVVRNRQNLVLLAVEEAMEVDHSFAA